MICHLDSRNFVRRMEAAGMARGIAEELADALGAVVLDGLVTRRDLDEGLARSDGHLRETVKELELRMTLRLGGIMAATTAVAVAILGALIALR